MSLLCGAETPYLRGSFSAYRPGFLQNIYMINHPLRLDDTVFVGGHFIRYGRRIRALGQKLSAFLYPLGVLEGVYWGVAVPGFSPTFHRAFLLLLCA
jgi:hypothetical protein